MNRLAASLCLVLASLGAGERAPGPAVATGVVPVAAVLPGEAADLVILDGGHAQGIRPGMVCGVSRAGRPLARLIVAESLETRAVALVLDLAPGEVLRPGDRAEARANPRI
jgi:hypothetical protein